MNDPHPPPPGGPRPPRAWGPGSQSSPPSPQPPPPPPPSGAPPPPAAPQGWSQPPPPPPAGAPGWGAPPTSGPPPPGNRFPPPGQGQPPPAWGGPPPPPKKSRTGLIVGLVIGGVVLLLLLVVGLIGLIALGRSSQDTFDSALPDLTSTSTLPTPRPTTGVAPRGPATSVAGTGARASTTSDELVDFLRKQQSRAFPDIAIGNVSCPSDPYRVGHVILCEMQLESSPVRYRVEISGVTTYLAAPDGPIIDTDKGESLIESTEPGSTADCGSPRIRQFTVGATFSCTTASTSWEFTVEDEEGRVTGSRRR